MSTTENVGAAAPPEPQGYDLVPDPDDPSKPYDPFGDGTRIYGCPECGATWNADDLHDETCSRRDAPCPACNGFGSFDVYGESYDCKTCGGES